MKINLTDIKETKKGRMALFFDGEFIFSVLPEIVLEYHLKIGDIYDTEYIVEVQRASELKDAKAKGYHYLSYRAYSKKALTDKLALKFSPETAAQAVREIDKLGYLDDWDYAGRLARDYYQIKLKSKRHIKQELLRKGIDRELTEAVLLSEDFDDRQTLFRLIDKKYLRKLSQEDGRQKVSAALARLGFSWDDIKYVLREYDEN